MFIRVRPAALQRTALVCGALLALPSCRKTDRTAGNSAPATVLAAVTQTADLRLAYIHEITIGLPAKQVAPHFIAARDRCLEDRTSQCVLIEASLDEEARANPYPSAHLDVRLPHEAVTPFVQALTAPLPGEQADDIIVRSRATRADDLSRPIADGTRRLAQLTDYRDRLTALAARPDTHVDDLIKIAGQLSQVQSDIEAASAEQRGLAQRVDTERLMVLFRADAASGGAFAPTREIWNQSTVILGDSAGDALRFAIIALPWLPIGIIGLLIVRWIWRGRRTRTATPIGQQPAPSP